MSEVVIELKQASQIARAFNQAFNNAFMYGGSHQTTKDSAASFFLVMQPLLDSAGILTVSADKESIFCENHCVDKLVSTQRINNRFKKLGVQSISFDRETSRESALALFYVMGSLSDFPNVDAMRAFLASQCVSGIRINYVVYRKVTLDDAIVNKDVLSETRLQSSAQQLLAPGSYLRADPAKIFEEFSEILSLRTAADHIERSAAETDASSRLSPDDYDKFITSQIRSINNRLETPEGPEHGGTLTPAEMLETVYKLKESVLENIRLQRETGKLFSADELVITELNQVTYQVIVRLIREEYRNDRKISVKRLAQIIRRMLPDITELKSLLPQLKDGLFAEGMSPSDYLSLVKELSRELDSDGLIQIMIEASDQIGLTFNELVEGIKDAPEESARLIVLAAEIKKGGVRADHQQMSAVLSDYIENVSRALALQAPETEAPGGGALLKAAVTRIEREIIERLKSQNVALNTVSDVAQKLASQFAETVSTLKGDWVRTHIARSKNPDENTVLSIIEQIAEGGQEDNGVTEEIRAILISNGFSTETIDAVVKKAQMRAAAAITHALEIPPGAFNAATTVFFMDREIKLNQRYNTPFSTVLISYQKVVDLRTYTMVEVTPDISIQLTNQALTVLKKMRRDLDLVGIYKVNTVCIPLMVLPMTDITGALFVKKRIDKELPCHEFEINGITVHVEPHVTVCGYNKKLTPEKLSYLREIYQLHCRPKLQ